MPQMYPLNWMVMMPFSIFMVIMYLMSIYYMCMLSKFKIKMENGMLKKSFNWEW